MCVCLYFGVWLCCISVRFLSDCLDKIESRASTLWHILDLQKLDILFLFAELLPFVYFFGGKLEDELWKLCQIGLNDTQSADWAITENI